MTAEPVCDVRCSLGESPVWSAGEQAVYWIDINKKLLHRITWPERDVTTWTLPSHPGMIAERASGGWIIALEDGVHAFDSATGALSLLVALEADRPELRPNDGKCDAHGRLWVGTLCTRDPDRPIGSFYRIDPDLRVTQVRTGLRIPNGLAWTPDNAAMFTTDTRTGVVERWRFDAERGTAADAETFFAYDKTEIGGADGAAMDTDGGYWVALYRGGRIARIDSSGTIVDDIVLSARQPTMPAFGGPEMKTVFVTTAFQGMPSDAVETEPAAGALLAASAPDGITGHPVYPFGG